VKNSSQIFQVFIISMSLEVFDGHEVVVDDEHPRPRAETQAISDASHDHRGHSYALNCFERIAASGGIFLDKIFIG